MQTGIASVTITTSNQITNNVITLAKLTVELQLLILLGWR